MITTVQCCICSQLNNKPRVVVTDFSCTIPAVYGFTHQVGYYYKLTLQPTHIQPRHNKLSVQSTFPPREAIRQCMQYKGRGPAHKVVL